MKQNNRRKWLACMLAVVLLLSQMTAISFAAEQSFAGSGTAEDPFLIATAEDLLNASELSNSDDNATRSKYGGSWANDANQTSNYTVYYKIINDIDMTGKTFYGFGRSGVGYKNMGGYSHGFRGVINGDGHVISNLTITGEEEKPVGLVCRAVSTTITDLGLENVTITAGKNAGAFIGHSMDTSTLQACYVNGLVNNATLANGHYGNGGLMGCRYSQTSNLSNIQNCYALSVKGNGVYGIIGRSPDGGVSGANMINCYTDVSAYSGDITTATNVYSQATAENLSLDKLNASITSATGARTDYAFEADKNEINLGYPVLGWQNTRPIKEPVKTDEYFYGSGTLADPFQIRTAEDLSNLEKLSNSQEEATKIKYAGNYPNDYVYYKLRADINMEGRNFNGIGRNDLSSVKNNGGYGAGFMGVFDGNGHVIKNLVVTGKAGAGVGLFGQCLNSTFKNLGLENVVIEGNGSSYAGALLANDKGYGTKIENCYAKNVTIKDSGNNSHYGVGGLVGQCQGNVDNPLHSVTFTNCYTLNVKSENAPLQGGIMGIGVSGTSANASSCYSDIAPFKMSAIGEGNVSVFEKVFTAGTDTFTASDLGNGFAEDAKINDGLPVLVWEKEREEATVTTAKVTVTTDGNGKLLWEKTAGVETLADGEYTVDAGVYLKLRPDANAGYEIDKILVDGEEVTLKDGVVSVPVNDGCTITVFFKEMEAMADHAFFVSPDGNDENAGTIDAPFKTLQRAKEAVNFYKNITLPEGTPITVYLRGGDYVLDDTVLFSTADSGTKENPIVYSAYQDEEVVLLGGTKVDGSLIEDVTDEAILSRLSDQSVRSKIKQIDLTKVGVTNIPKIPDAYTPSSSIPLGVDFYLNGSHLDVARWPNAGLGNDSYVKVKKAVRDTTMTLWYNDASDRAAKWSEQAFKYLHVEGAMPYGWCTDSRGVKSMDIKEKSVTLKARPTYNSDHDMQYFPHESKIFFKNLLEEIDVPGEYFADYDTKMFYFYPNVKDMETAELYMATDTKVMLEVNGAEYLTFKNLDFKYTQKTPVVIAANHITLDGLHIAHTSEHGIQYQGNYNTIENCHIHDYGTNGIYLLKDGNRETLTSGGNVIRNNRIHGGTRSGYAIEVGYSVGLLIENNELYDATNSLIHFQFPNEKSGNDAIIRYNDIYRACQTSTDAGAINWGRNPSAMGNQIVNNYIHHIGSGIKTMNANGGVFIDDGGSNPYTANNVFYKADWAYRTNGGQYGLVTNNIFVDNTSSVAVQWWRINDMEGYPKAARWYLYVMDKTEKPVNLWSSALKVGSETNIIENDIWREHYKNTQWAPFFEVFTMEKYNEIKEKNGKDAGDYAELSKWAVKNAPETNFQVQNNLLLNSPLKTQKDSTLWYVGEDWKNYEIEKKTIDEDIKSLFVDYDNENFSLTEEGLTKVRKTIPEFENIDMSSIGLRTDVGGHNPSAGGVTLIQQGDKLVCTYAFIDADGDKEGATKFTWYASDAENGEYTRLACEDYELKLDDSLKGKYIYCEVTPYDINGMYGETIATKAVNEVKSIEEQVAETMKTAEKMLTAVPVGTNFGEAEKSVHDALKVAIEEAKKSATLETLTALNNQIGIFQAAVNQELPAEIADGTNLLVHQVINDLELNLDKDAKNVSLTLTKGVELPEIIVNGYVLVNGEKQPATLTVPAGTIVKGDGTVKLNLFGDSTNPSVEVSGANATSIQLTGEKLSLNQPVSLFVQNAGKKMAGYVENGKSNGISSNSLESKGYSREKSGDDLKLNTTALGELLLFDLPTQTTSPTPTPTSRPTSGPMVPNGPGTSVGVGGGISGVSGNQNKEESKPATKFADIIGHWAENDINDMADKGIVSGVTATTFEPDRSITRAEFAALMTRALKLTAANDTAVFSDVSADSWYKDAVSSAAAAGLIVGYDGNFRPNDTITREEMAVVIMKAYKFLGNAPLNGKINQFTDKDEISAWAVDYVDGAVSSGLISGMTADTFAPKENATRAQVASLIKRLLK